MFYFSADCFIEVCPSERSDGVWITIASSTLKPRSDHIYIEDLWDYLVSYGISTEELNQIDIACTPRRSSPYVTKGKWDSLVYFIQGEEGGPIKIGFTTSLKERLSALQAASPLIIKTISCFPASLEDERELHKVFNYCHSHFEWFSPDVLLQVFSRSFLMLYPHLGGVSVDSKSWVLNV